MTPESLALQVGQAMAYYIGIVLLMRFAGKRLAGQTTTFDLLMLIAMATTLQSALLEKGKWQALAFFVTILVCHKGLTWACTLSTTVRHLVRGKPRVLVRSGQILAHALEREGLSEEELLAGLRKLGHESAAEVETATLEETGHISAVARS